MRNSTMAFVSVLCVIAILVSIAICTIRYHQGYNDALSEITLKAPVWEAQNPVITDYLQVFSIEDESGYWKIFYRYKWEKQDTIIVNVAVWPENSYNIPYYWEFYKGKVVNRPRDRENKYQRVPPYLKKLLENHRLDRFPDDIIRNFLTQALREEI